MCVCVCARVFLCAYVCVCVCAAATSPRFAVLGTLVSTFTVGLGLYGLAKAGIITGIDDHDPLQALLFGALISAVDPVATLSIMGRADLNCEPLLYSLVFGESVLNDAVSIVLFKTFASLASQTSVGFAPLALHCVYC